MGPEIQTAQQFLGHKQFCSYAYYSLISIFLDNLTVDKVIYNFDKYKKTQIHVRMTEL
jgi:hypothetical protein